MSQQHSFGQASQIFQTCRCHFQILGARRVIWSMSHPHFSCGLCILLLSGIFCSVHVDWYIFLYVRVEENCNNCAENIGFPHKNFVTWAIRHPRFLCLCICDCLLHLHACRFMPHITWSVERYSVFLLLLMLGCYTCCFLFHLWNDMCITLLKVTGGELLLLHTFLLGV